MTMYLSYIEESNYENVFQVFHKSNVTLILFSSTLGWASCIFFRFQSWWDSNMLYLFSFAPQFAHRKCIQIWCNEKGNIVCEICHQVLNYTPLFTSNLFLETILTIIEPNTPYFWSRGMNLVKQSLSS